MVNWSSKGKVWLRGRWLLVVGVAGSSGRAVNGAGGMNGLGAVPESGVKKGEVGDKGPGEKDEGACSANALLSDVPLCEWKGPLRPENSM